MKQELHRHFVEGIKALDLPRGWRIIRVTRGGLIKFRTNLCVITVNPQPDGETMFNEDAAMMMSHENFRDDVYEIEDIVRDNHREINLLWDILNLEKKL